MGAEIRRQQRKEETKKGRMSRLQLKDVDSKSVDDNKPQFSGLTLRLNSVELDLQSPRTRRHSANSAAGPSPSSKRTRHPPSGYLNVFDMPATPPLSSVGGQMSDASRSELQNMELDE